MQDIAADIYHAINSGKLALPSLPEMALRIRAAVNAEDATALRVAKIIELDPNITGRIIQMANSSIFSGHKNVTSCEEAVMRLGLRVVRDMVTCMAMQQLYTAPVGLLKTTLAQLWEASVHVAAISCVLASITPRMNPEKALLAGLVHNIGALPVVSYAESHPALSANKAVLQSMLDELRGPIGKLILESWNFDTELTAIPMQISNWFRDENEIIDYADIVIVAKVHSLYGKTNNNIPGLTELPAFNKMRLSKLGPDASLELLHEAKSDIKQVLKMLH